MHYHNLKQFTVFKRYSLPVKQFLTLFSILELRNWRLKVVDLPRTTYIGLKCHSQNPCVYLFDS